MWAKEKTFRNLPRDQLGGVIFGCKNDTIRECLEKQLVGQLFGPNILTFDRQLGLLLLNYIHFKIFDRFA